MKSTEATVFDRKSGGAEGPAVRLDFKQRPASELDMFGDLELAFTRSLTT
jgi:hypothetical protein